MATLYEHFEWLLRDASFLKLAGTELSLEKKEETIDLIYRGTSLIKAFPDGRLQLRDGGYKSKMTREYMNRYLPLEWEVYQEKSHWYVKSHKWASYEYRDKMMLWPDGAQVAYE